MSRRARGLRGVGPRGAVFALWLAMLTFTAPAAAPAAIPVGTRAPSFTLPAWSGGTFSLDEATTLPTLLVFSRAEDRHSSHTLEMTDALLGRNAELGEHVRRVWVVTARDSSGRAVLPPYLGASAWAVLRDEEGTVASDYKFIASPTLYIIDAGGQVVFSHPGYDPGLALALRSALAELLDPALAARLAEVPVRPNMTLQLGRRLADRGLWDRALVYYDRAAAEEPLHDEALLELATIHAQLGEYARATEILDSLSPESVGAERLDAIRRDIADRTENAGRTHEPPVVHR